MGRGVSKVGTFSSHPVNRWFQRFTHDPVHDGRDRHRRWGICTHSACIKPCIALADPFVILRCRQRNDGVSIGERKDGDLWSDEQLFDDDLVAFYMIGDSSGRSHDKFLEGRTKGLTHRRPQRRVRP